MRIILFFSIVFSGFEFSGCTPMNSEQGVVAHEEKKIASSLISLVQKIRDSDTILLTSHTGNVIDTSSGETKLIEPEVMIGDKINRKIIHEQKVITASDIDTLISILSIPKPAEDSLSVKCFEPHHTIFIIKNNKVSYMDLCFHCAGVAISDDLTGIRPFGESKWMKLLTLFKRLNLTYKLPKTILPMDE